jgi:hypothetical protein
VVEVGVGQDEDVDVGFGQAELGEAVARIVGVGQLRLEVIGEVGAGVLVHRFADVATVRACVDQDMAAVVELNEVAGEGADGPLTVHVAGGHDDAEVDVGAAEVEDRQRAQCGRAAHAMLRFLRPVRHQQAGVHPGGRRA